MFRVPTQNNYIKQLLKHHIRIEVHSNPADSANNSSRQYTLKLLILSGDGNT